MSPAASPELSLVDKEKVGALARRGAFWSVVQIVARNLISIGSTAILARLLAPDDYGLMGMVATLTTLLLVFSDMGLSWATIQRRELTQAQVSNLFWVNVLSGAALWLVCIGVAPWVSRFYGRDELRMVIFVLGGTFFLGGLSVQPFALLRRRMDFRAVAFIEIVAGMVAVTVAISCALSGIGYWALVIQGVAGQLARAVLAFPASRIRLQPPIRGAGTREMVGFGGLLALNGLLIYLARNLDSVLIGKFWGTESLGYYDRAYFLMLLPSTLATGALANLMVPSLSALQEDRSRFGDAYRRALRLVAFVGCPMAVGLALVASEAVSLVYGEKWLPVAPMLVWLSLAGVTQPIYNTTGWLFTAAGKGRLYFSVTFVNAVVLAVAFLWGVQRGAVQVAMAYGLVMGGVLIWPALLFAHKAAGLKLSESLRALGPVGIAVAAMALSVLSVGYAAQRLGAQWGAVLVLKVLVGVGVYGLVALVLLRPMLRSDVLPMVPARFRGRA